MSKLGHQRVNQVFERLATAEILSRQEHRVLGLIPTTRWITIDPEPERQLRARLDQVVLFGGESDPEVAALGGLLMAVRLLVCRWSTRGRRVDARAVKQRGKELLQQYWPAVALQKAAVAGGGERGSSVGLIDRWSSLSRPRLRLRSLRC